MDTKTNVVDAINDIKRSTRTLTKQVTDRSDSGQFQCFAGAKYSNIEVLILESKL